MLRTRLRDDRPQLYCLLVLAIAGSAGPLTAGESPPRVSGEHAHWRFAAAPQPLREQAGSWSLVARSGAALELLPAQPAPAASLHVEFESAEPGPLLQGFGARVDLALDGSLYFQGNPTQARFARPHAGAMALTLVATASRVELFHQGRRIASGKPQVPAEPSWTLGSGLRLREAIAARRPWDARAIRQLAAGPAPPRPNAIVRFFKWADRREGNEEAVFDLPPNCNCPPPDLGDLGKAGNATASTRNSLTPPVISTYLPGLASAR